MTTPTPSSSFNNNPTGKNQYTKEKVHFFYHDNFEARDSQVGQSNEEIISLIQVLLNCGVKVKEMSENIQAEKGIVIR
jgi:hypothetical protein